MANKEYVKRWGEFMERNDITGGVVTVSDSEVVQINKALLSIEKQIDRLAKDYIEQATKFATANAEYKIAHASAFMRAKLDGNTDEMSKAISRDSCKEQYTKYRIAEQVALSTREALRASQATLTSIQTRAGLLRTEASLTRY